MADLWDGQRHSTVAARCWTRLNWQKKQPLAKTASQGLRVVYCVAGNEKFSAHPPPPGFVRSCSLRSEPGPLAAPPVPGSSWRMRSASRQPRFSVRVVSWVMAVISLTSDTGSGRRQAWSEQRHRELPGEARAPGVHADGLVCRRPAAQAVRSRV